MVLAKRDGINQKTVAKWKRRTAVKDLPTGPQDAHSTVLSIEDEAIIVAFRKHTLLPLDDCLYALQATIPHLTRSSLHRCLQRHGDRATGQFRYRRATPLHGTRSPYKTLRCSLMPVDQIKLAKIYTVSNTIFRRNRTEDVFKVNILSHE